MAKNGLLIVDLMVKKVVNRVKLINNLWVKIVD